VTSVKKDSARKKLSKEKLGDVEAQAKAASKQERKFARTLAGVKGNPEEVSGISLQERNQKTKVKALKDSISESQKAHQEAAALHRKSQAILKNMEREKQEAAAKVTQQTQEVNEQSALVKSMSSERTYKDHLKNRQRRLDERFIETRKDEEAKNIKSVDIRAKAIPLVEQRIQKANSLIPLKEEAEDAVEAVKELSGDTAKAAKESKQKNEASLQLKLDKKAVDKASEQESRETDKNEGAQEVSKTSTGDKMKLEAAAKAAEQQLANAREAEATAKERETEMENKEAALETDKPCSSCEKAQEEIAKKNEIIDMQAKKEEEQEEETKTEEEMSKNAEGKKLEKVDEQKREAEDMAKQEKKAAAEAEASQEETEAKLNIANKEIAKNDKKVEKLEAEVKNGDVSKKETLDQAKSDAADSKAEKEALKQKAKEAKKVAPDSKSNNAQASNSSWVLNWNSFSW